LTASRLSDSDCAISSIVSSGLVNGFMGATPVTGQFLALSDDRQQAFVAHVVERLVSYVDDAGMAVPQENNFLTASKSG
jgi:hypothetical protein